MYKNLNCYANHLNDCSTINNKEHPIPHCSLFQLFGNEQFDAVGWTSNPIPLSAANANSKKLLCEKHNNQLSDFASEGKKWVQAINVFNGQENPPIEGYTNISKLKLIKLMLESGCGILALRGKANEIPLSWINFLFLQEENSNFRLAIPSDYEERQFLLDKKQMIFAVIEDNNQIIGCTWQVRNLKIHLFTDDIQTSKFGHGHSLSRWTKKDKTSKFVIYFRD